MIDGRQNPPIEIADLIPERVLWPEFIELDGMIFLKNGFDPRHYKSWMADFQAEAPGHVLSIETRLEAILNARYLKEIFLGTGYVPERKMLEQLGKLMEENWQTKLNVEFPGRQIKASFIQEFDNTGFAGWYVTANRSLDDEILKCKMMASKWKGVHRK
jgi:hypothetical protein